MTDAVTRPIFPCSVTSRAGKSEMNAVFERKSACTTKSQLKLSIGDPTFDGNLCTSEAAITAMKKYTHKPTNYSYQRAWGAPDACAAVAEYWNRRFCGANTDACKTENVAIVTGGAESIIHTITALCDTGDNLLIPAPGFPAYQYACDTFGIEGRHYNLLPHQNWEVNLEEVRGLVDDRTKAIFLNNPSNPCGSNWSHAHVKAIIELAEELKLPIISDEIYCGMVYSGQTFTSVAEFDTCVPRFILCGLAKNFMVPGWRVGWIIMLDRDHHATAIMESIRNLSMTTIGPNAVAQHALPDILRNTPADYYAKNMEEIEANARCFAEGLKKCGGLTCAEPQGALYIMVEIHLDEFDGFANDVEFYKALEDEENIQVVPGSYLFIPGFFRVCITRQKNVIEEVMERLPAFCERHRKK